MDMPVRTAVNHANILRRGWYMGMVAPVEIASLSELEVTHFIYSCQSKNFGKYNGWVGYLCKPRPQMAKASGQETMLHSSDRSLY